MQAQKAEKNKKAAIEAASWSVNLSPSVSEATEARECEPPAKRGRKKASFLASFRKSQ